MFSVANYQVNLVLFLQPRSSKLLQSGIWMIQTSPLMRDKPGTVFSVEPKKQDFCLIHTNISSGIRCFDNMFLGSSQTEPSGLEFGCLSGNESIYPTRKTYDRNGKDARVR